MTELQPLGGSSAARSTMYWGERADWLVAYAIHRDSDALDRSNFEVIREDLEKLDLWNVAIERFTNFLVGWTDHLLVKPNTVAAEAALQWRERLDDYPVADEMHFSQLEWDEEHE